MADINFLAILAAAVASFVVSTVWYILFGKQLAVLSQAMTDMKSSSLWKKVLELIRCLILAFVIATLASLVGLNGISDSLSLALILWVGFPLILLSGSVLWEKVPGKLAAIHAGDWLLKLLIMCAIIGLWQ